MGTPYECKREILDVRGFATEANVLYLLSFLCEINGNTQINSLFVPTYILKALSFIEANYQEKITADSLSKTLYIGRTTLMTNFKKHTGSTLNDYINATRLKKTLSLLQSSKSESETAELCGFDDFTTFYRSFKRFYGTSPSKYRANT